MKKVLVAVSLWLTVSFAPPALAAENKPKPTGISISPAFQEVTLQQGQQAVGGSFSIANHGDTPETFEISAVDMGSLDDTGGLAFSGLPQDYQEKYGLAKWLTLAQSQVTVSPRNVSKVGFTIKNESSLSPGGHYGAIVVRPAGGIASSQRVTISPQAASLLFLRKIGGEAYGLSLPQIDDNHSVWRLPTKVTLPFKNEGNVHVVPRGLVRVRDTFGKEVARGVINPESAMILPERNRTFTVDLQTSRHTIWPARYTIEVDYRYDGQEQTTHLTKTFFTANLRMLLLLVGLVATLCLTAYKIYKYKAWRLITKRSRFFRRRR